MKRHILEITEIDCGDETCEGCRQMGFGKCMRFIRRLRENTKGEFVRLPECLEAERAYGSRERILQVALGINDAREARKAQGPPDSIGE